MLNKQKLFNSDSEHENNSFRVCVFVRRHTVRCTAELRMKNRVRDDDDDGGDDDVDNGDIETEKPKFHDSYVMFTLVNC